MARVRSALRIKSLHDKLHAEAKNLAALNLTLEQRIATQVAEIKRIGQLTRFLPAQVAELILSAGDERLLESHRREVTVVFCDLRGFTPFAETSEPEDVISVLHEYHAALGALINKFEGTIVLFAGDGLLVLFNDPLPCADPSVRAVRMSIEMRDEISRHSVNWRKHGHELGFGNGIACGHATLGCVGFEGRFQYSATGTVVNLATRLCEQALDGEILVDVKVHTAVQSLADLEPAGELALKGFRRPVRAFNVRKADQMIVLMN